ncbi:MULTISPECIES: outer membrane beta-barrel protein [Vibrio oreintalis group]|uniref:outer membrane beta-barrel protein n=1 Tax=Vibrio oreintalis group TaxID=1891919 RepID=UPI00148C88E9|nr:MULTISPECIES: outer membrane beta-barrel protein [Vibrio oreintalis group]MCG9575098.1 outer membrane beta-barrel protein [Vibrio tubiashii]MDC5818459.1 outer membrane beta-barrel protein [Vibrio europaeus]MDC5839334.1 outer membrane beta-barrel protein [Vibrio europaeus]MDC5857098.1 outer membrane beta-barrel protein [Vibrio europaeus]MDC5871518.1 outer membrane beta-barrel protein [Vibrio europaeus]
MFNRTILAATLLVACSAANANSYIGATAGQATFDNINGNVNTSIYSTSERIEVSDDDSPAIKIFGGYEFNQYIAVEGSIGGYDALDGQTVSVGDMKFAAVQAKAMLPVGEKFKVFAKGGFAYFGAEFKTSYYTLSDETVTGKFGLGAEFELSPNVHLLAEWDYMNPELDLIKVGANTVSIDAEINVFSLGVSYHF